MRVVGIAGWESTQRLQDALQAVESDKVLCYGTDPRRMNGWEQLQAFNDARVPCPEFTNNLSIAHQWRDTGSVVFGRKLHHARGSDIYSAGRRWSEADYWTKFILSVREFRQHIFSGRAIRIGEKIHMGESWRKLLVRSRNNGWMIQYPPAEEVPKEVRQVSKAAVQAVGYLFGAVDVVMDTEGRVWVLEVNSAPSLRDNGTLEAYVKEVKRWVAVR